MSLSVHSVGSGAVRSISLSSNSAHIGLALVQGTPGRHGEALRLLRHALATGADPVPMVAAFASKVRTMAKLAGARGSAGDLARQFGLAPWQVERARRDLSGWDDAGLGRAIQALASADAQVKGAGRDPVFALEHLVGVIAARGRA